MELKNSSWAQRFRGVPPSGDKKQNTKYQIKTLHFKVKTVHRKRRQKSAAMPHSYCLHLSHLPRPMVHFHELHESVIGHHGLCHLSKSAVYVLRCLSLHFQSLNKVTGENWTELNGKMFKKHFSWEGNHNCAIGIIFSHRSRSANGEVIAKCSQCQQLCTKNSITLP